MRTKEQGRAATQLVEFTHTDTRGVAWSVTATWAVVGGRFECTGLHLDSDGRGRLTSNLVRQVERALRTRAPFAVAPHSLTTYPDGPSPVGPLGPDLSAEATLAALPTMYSVSHDGTVPEHYPAPPADGAPRPAHRPVDHDLWRRRRDAMHAAYVARQPVLEALRDPSEAHITVATLQSRAKRTRAWDREHGGGQLEGMGKAQARDKPNA